MIGSLGYVTVTAAGTPVRATANRTNPAQRVATQSIVFQARHSNAGRVYIGLVGMNKTTGVGVLGSIPAPVSATTGPFQSWAASMPTPAAGLNAADFYVDADTNNDSVIVAITAG